MIMKVNVNMWVISHEDMDHLSINFIGIIVDLLTCLPSITMASMKHDVALERIVTIQGFGVGIDLFYEGHKVRLTVDSGTRTFTIMITR